MSFKHCAVDNCKLKLALIVGHCNHCNNDHCLKHRLPEDHKCQELINLQRKEHADNAAKLMAQKAQKTKIAAF